MEKTPDSEAILKEIVIDHATGLVIAEAIEAKICMMETGMIYMRAAAAEEFNKNWKPTVPDGSRKGVPQYRENPVLQIPIKALSREKRVMINTLEDVIAELRRIPK